MRPKLDVEFGIATPFRIVLMLTPHLEIELSEFAVQYSQMLFGFGHNLHKLDLFSDGQPQDWPYWVETTGARAVSYTFVYETTDGRSRALVRSFNHYLRRLHIEPLAPGVNPKRDALKSATMGRVIAVRKTVAKTLRSARALVLQAVPSIR
jgi:hypothetical protein